MQYPDIMPEMPDGYRWATAEETEEFLNSDHQWGRNREEYWVQVRVGGTDDEPWTDLAIQWDCMIEFGFDHDHDPVACERILADMNPSYDQTDYSEWYGGERGYQDGLRWSDFV